MQRVRTVIWFAAAVSMISAFPASAEGERPRLYTNESYVEDVTRQTTLPLQDPKAMLAFVLDSLPDRVKVYPTENYYYFYFYHDGIRYAGNIRLDAQDRDEGKLHFAYYPELTEWQSDDPQGDGSGMMYRVLGKDDGVLVERLEPLIYRVAYEQTSVLFALNDLSDVVPPPQVLAPDDNYLGPVFDDSAIRFFLVYNTRLKIFHYVLDETVKVADVLAPSRRTDRILIGRRTGFAFYRDHRLDRKILIGVFERNADLNNYYDGPFDQLPDNFLKGDALRRAILEVEPKLAGKIDRFGGSPGGEYRYMIAPYLHYRRPDELYVFHECATSEGIASNLYHACFSIIDNLDDHEDEKPTTSPPTKQSAPKQ